MSKTKETEEKFATKKDESAEDKNTETQATEETPEGKSTETDKASEEATSTPEGTPEGEEKASGEEEPVVKEDTLEEARKATQEDEQNKKPVIERLIVGDKSYSAKEATEIIEAHFALLKERHDEKLDALFELHADNLTDDEVTALRKGAEKKDISDIENAIFATIGRKNFSTKSKSKASTPSVDYASVVTIDNEDINNKPYDGVLDQYL